MASERKPTKRMLTVIRHLQHGNKLHTTGGRRWIDCGFECGVAPATFLGLIARHLIRRVRPHVWGLSAKGRLL
jgi:hypothetical protein